MVDQIDEWGAERGMTRSASLRRWIENGVKERWKPNGDETKRGQRAVSMTEKLIQFPDIKDGSDKLGDDQRMPTSSSRLHRANAEARCGSGTDQQNSQTRGGRTLIRQTLQAADRGRTRAQRRGGLGGSAGAGLVSWGLRPRSSDGATIRDQNQINTLYAIGGVILLAVIIAIIVQVKSRKDMQLAWTRPMRTEMAHIEEIVALSGGGVVCLILLHTPSARHCARICYDHRSHSAGSRRNALDWRQHAVGHWYHCRPHPGRRFGSVGLVRVSRETRARTQIKK